MSSTKNNENETRTRILQSALQLLEDRGGKDVRMSDIAKLAQVSRQAVYLHFQSRNNLMVQTVQYGDQIRDAKSQTKRWREAQGIEKLDAWIEFWGQYVPQIFGVAKALMLDKEHDEAASAAWTDRMDDVRRSCKRTIQAVDKENRLHDFWTVKTASDTLWTMLSIESWERYTQHCNWSTKQYIERMKTAAKRSFLTTDESAT